MEVALFDELVPLLGQGFELPLLDGDVGPDTVHLSPHLKLGGFGCGEVDNFGDGGISLNVEWWNVFGWRFLGTSFLVSLGALRVSFGSSLPGVSLWWCGLLLGLGFDLQLLIITLGLVLVEFIEVFIL